MSMLSRFATLGGVAGDPYWNYVTLLLTGDGSSGSQVFTDLSSSPKAITAYGTAQISTAVKKYGTGAMYFDGTGDYLRIPHSSAFNFGSGDFTIEFWYYTSSAVANCGVLNKWGAGNYEWGIFNVSGVLQFVWTSAGTNLTYIGTGGLLTNAWNHIAVAKSGNTINFYKNGILNVTATESTGIYNGSNPVVICNNGGALTSGWEFNGYIDDLRITKGYARYTANFTPPTAPLPTN